VKRGVVGRDLFPGEEEEEEGVLQVLQRGLPAGVVIGITRLGPAFLAV
jgi:hypothetical protein